MTTLESARAALAEEWRRLNPTTEEEIAAFYRNTHNYKDDLDAWHSLEERQEWSVIIYAAARAINAARILDVGAGAGHDLRFLRSQQPELWLEAVEPNEVLRAALMFDGFKANADFSSINVKTFDLVSCIDVLEHVPNPESLLDEIIGVLRMGGIFVEATATHDTDTPLHLPSLRGWSPARYLDRHGFVVREKIGRVRVWQRVSQARSKAENIILCTHRQITAETTGCLLQLADRGWRRLLHRGDALVSRIRSRAVSTWMMEDDNDVFLMIDDDIIFQPTDAQKVVDLAREKRSIASAAYAVRGGTHFASRFKPIEGGLLFGPKARPVEIEYAATGFIAVHRDVCDAIIKMPDMPLCRMAADGDFFWPMFMPFCIEGEEWSEYLSEDFAFCERAQRLGFKVWLDPSVELGHLGLKTYTVADTSGSQIVGEDDEEVSTL